jgi:hypothetical protein
MFETHAWRATPLRGVAAPASTAEERPGRRVHRHLWRLLNAQALLNGMAGGRGDVTVAEDDYHRLAARRAR